MSGLSAIQMPQGDIITYLRNAKELTGGLDEAELHAIAAIAEAVEVAEGVLLDEDERSRDLYVVVEGAINVEIGISPHGDDSVTLLTMRAGGVAGEVAFVDGSRRSAILRAGKRSVLLMLPHTRLEQLCKANNTIGFKVLGNLAQLIAKRLRSTNFELRSRLS